jgi:hypothetical protein
MKELPYTDLRFKTSPIRKRIFWPVLSGLLASLFLADPVLIQGLWPNQVWPHSDGIFVGQGSLLDIEIKVRSGFFFCAALFVHLILLLTTPPRFQFSLMRLLLATFLIALFFSANLLPQRVVSGHIVTVTYYGWPLQLCSVVDFHSGNIFYEWQAPYCALASTLLLLTTLNILLFKFPKSPKDVP